MFIWGGLAILAAFGLFGVGEIIPAFFWAAVGSGLIAYGIHRNKQRQQQAQLGKRIGVAKTTISGYEIGTRQLDPATICTLCDLFGCTADYLLGRSLSPAPVMSSQDAIVLEAYHALPLELRRAVDGILEPYREPVREKKDA